MTVTSRLSAIQEQLENIDDVQAALELLEHDLPVDEVPLLRHFNYTYLIVTRNVRQAMKAGRFEHPDFISRFDARFAYYYLRALELYMQNEQTPQAWLKAFQYAKPAHASPFKVMALGVNAHVNNDIAQVLADLQADIRHYQDYVLVNKIIYNSLDETLDRLWSDDGRIRLRYRLARPGYKIVMRQLVVLWRHNAWLSFQRLSMRRKTVEKIESTASKMALAIARMPL